MEQFLYGCAGAIEASVKEIKLQLNESREINVIDEQTIPTQWYIEKGNVTIPSIDPWWGGVEFGENIPKNSKIVSENSLFLPAGFSFFFGFKTDADCSGAPALALETISGIIVNYQGYRGDGFGNLELLQRWKEEGTTKEGISRMFQRQWKDVMVNLVTPTHQTEILGPIQITTEKTCYDLRYAIQFYLATFGLIVIFCIFIISIKGLKSFAKIKQTVRQMDLGRAVLNLRGLAEASTANSSTWIKLDGKKLISIGDTYTYKEIV